VRVDQVIPSLASRDAIGVHTINLRDGLRHVGIDSDIYYGSFTADVQHEGRSVTELGRAGRDRWLLYQSSIGSPVYDIFAARPEPKLVNYHNITPAHLLRDWEPDVAYEVALGRTQLSRLAPQSRFAVADSAFNESELRALGYEGTAVVPLLIDMHRKSGNADPLLVAELDRRKAQGGADLLFVGKVSPHKAPHDLVKMLAVLRRLYDPLARLHLVGSPLGETYEPALRAFISELGLDDAVNLAG
jgi:glycosyltransferase involved in cell wall biosynthesis